MPLKDRLGLPGDPLFLVDGNAFIYRAFYAFPDLKRSDGTLSNALFIVLRLLFRLLREERPVHVGMFLDGRGSTGSRQAVFPEYKAQRQATPEPLLAQIEPIKEAVRLLGLTLVVSEGGEADDCIASLAARLKSRTAVAILGADKDLNQCLDENVVIWDPGLKTEKLVTLKSFTEEYRMAPAHWPDYQALIGDSSDNIPGVPGVGPKTALKLLERFPTLEDLRDHFDELTPAEKKKLTGHVDQAFTYRELTRLATSQCDHMSLEDFARQAVDGEALAAFLTRWEFRSLLREAAQLFGTGQPAAGAGRSGGPGASTDRAESAGRTDGQAASTETAGAPAAAPPQGGGLNASARDGASGRGGSGRGRPKSEQLTLFSAAVPAAEVAAPPPVPLADLPPLAGRAVGLLSAASLEETPGMGVSGAPVFHLGLDDRDLTVAAAPAELAPRLAQAAFIGVDSLKPLLRADPAWEAIPLAAWFDLGLAAYLLDPEDEKRDYGWRRLRLSLADRLPDQFSDQSPGQPSDQSPERPQENGLGLSALRLARSLEERLRQAGLIDLMHALETPLIPVLTAMERRGVRIDQAAFAGFLAEVGARLDELTRSIHAHAGGPFNLRSGQQLAEVLFTKLELGGKGKSKKTPGGAQSTAVAVLEKLVGRHPIVAEILEFRKLEKLRSTYLEPLPRLAGPDGRVRTTFNNLATATGRLSSSNPNLQNIPIRGEFGQRMRSCFTAEPGRLLVAADYSQIELRILAHAAQDPALLSAFAAQEDIHRRTAALIFDKAPEDVAPDERRSAKTINFGLLYGMGPQRLAGELGVSLAQAKEFIERYFARLGALRRFYEGVVEQAKAQGFVTTMFGRRRLLPRINSRNENEAQTARRQAINTVIQGSAADIIKMAMLQAHADEELRALGAELILQVHDELVLEAPEESARQAGERLAAIMCAVRRLDAPLTVDWGVGPNWGEAH